MIIKEIEYKLKDGRNAIIRSPREEDIQGMLDLYSSAVEETDFLLSYPEECGEYTAEAEKNFIDKINAADNEAFLVCLVDGKIAGNCQITWSNKIKLKHRASASVAVLSEFWNQGIGTKLFETLIQIAEENKDILQIELEFIEGNSRARALYEKMGFRITGVKPNAIRLKDGTLLNEYEMIREIKR